MVQINKSIPENASDHVFELMKDKLPGIYVYHNYKHTEEVVESVKKLAGKQNLNADDIEIVTLAAWFHDIGFIEKSINHEDASVKIAEEYLRSINYSEEKIAKVIGCINATRYPQLPKNYLEEIIADADLLHLGTKEYYDRTELLRIEWERSENKKFTDLEWLKINIDFLTAHKYFTKYALKNYDEGKTEKLIKLQKLYRKKIKEAENFKIEKDKFDFKNEELSFKKESLKQVDMITDSERHESIYISVSKLFNQRNAIDGKANVMLIINSIFILLTLILFIFDQNIDQKFYLPIFILLATSLLCIIYSVFESITDAKSKNHDKNGIHGNSQNPFLISNFPKISLKEFSAKTNHQLNNKEELLESFIADFYFFSKEVLKKQEYLRICFLIFTYGILLSVIVFAIACIQTL